MPKPPAKRREGGQPGNTNGATHGMYVLGMLPKRLRNIERRAATFRRKLEDAVVERHGGVSVTQGALINSAARWERMAMLANNWLAKNWEDMGHMERLAYIKEATRASSERDKCLKGLHLDRPATDVYADLYATPMTLEAEVVDDAADVAGAAQQLAGPDGGNR